MATRIIKNEKLFRLLKAILRTMNNSRFKAVFYFRKCKRLSVKYICCLLVLVLLKSGSCNSQPAGEANPEAPIVCGDERMPELLALVKNKNVALLVNQTGVVGKTHLLDTLVAQHVKVKKVFAPEHGFRGKADAGEHVNDSVDAKTGIPVISLYGEKKKPSAKDLEGIDAVIFDVQDVGARFYTYISTLHYLMEACGENKKLLIVLDRPNPNGFYVDGPVLKKEFSSFVGVDPIPMVHGLTVGEYAQMVNGEKWLTGGVQCEVKVVTCLNYRHNSLYEITIPPSPNLPNTLAVTLYPSLCMLEGANVSVGRGTDAPFQIIGSPDIKLTGAFEFTPESKPGAKSPPFLNKKCYGFDLRKYNSRHGMGFTFQYVTDLYKLSTDKENFFLKNNFFDKLCGTDEIRKMIIAGKGEMEIKESYQKDLDSYKKIRNKYLLYE